MSSAKEAMYSADGDMILVPQLGALKVTTEMGKFLVSPKEIIVIGANGLANERDFLAPHAAY